jgi:hypothetical protein
MAQQMKWTRDGASLIHSKPRDGAWTKAVCDEPSAAVPARVTSTKHGDRARSRERNTTRRSACHNIGREFNRPPVSKHNGQRRQIDWERTFARAGCNDEDAPRPVVARTTTEFADATTSLLARTTWWAAPITV